MQAPLIRHVNDDPEAWAALWKTGVRLGIIPYYMFVERDTGARNYFEVPLVQCYEIFKAAYASVSGLSRSVRGPCMSAFPGKVRVLGIVSLRDMMDRAVIESVRDAVGFDILDPDKPMMVCDFIQARDPAWVRKPFFAEFDEDAAWFDELRPVFGKENPLSSFHSTVRARSTPSTNTLTFPSGSLTLWTMLRCSPSCRWRIWVCRSIARCWPKRTRSGSRPAWPGRRPVAKSS